MGKQNGWKQRLLVYFLLLTLYSVCAIYESYKFE